MSRSEDLFARALRLMPGGVSSPVRAFKAVGGAPLFVASAEGARITDADGRSFIDYVGSWGPMILGHAHPAVVAAVQRAAALGSSFGAPCAGEVELAERITRLMPSIERIRFVSSGTEAVMSALRLARAFTQRSKILKFDGGYHGHADAMLAAAGSGLATLGLPGSPGVPPSVVADTLVAPYNDVDAFESACRDQGRALAAVIVEPVAGNMGCVPPKTGFLAALRRVTQDVGALLIFDEVITGFRLGLGGAQEIFGVRPDLTCLGKIIGGGLPVGAYGGRAEIMREIAPEGPVYQAGTLSGNPLAMAAGCATLDVLAEPGRHEKLEQIARELAEGLRAAARAANVPLHVQRAGSLLTPFFGSGPVVDHETAKTADTRRYARFFHAMLARGVYPPPSQFEAWFVSCAHGDAEIQATLAAARESLREIAACR